MAPAFTPPPTLGRGPSFPGEPPPALADLLGEPILATDLAPEEDGQYQGSPTEALTPRQAALLDALDRTARGEESPLLRPGQLAALLARLLVKRGILTEAELLEALARKP